MSRLQSVIHRYDMAIWIRLFGTMMTTFATFMLRPFLAIYLYDKLDQSLIGAALIVGLQPAVGFITNLFSGSLSDRYGRKPLMLVALFVESIGMFCYIWANSLIDFALLTILNGAAAALFRPAANAQIADIVPEEKRSEVFSLFHIAVNVGVALGPFIGVAIYKVDPSIVFIACSVTLFFYGFLVLWKVPETLPSKQKLNSISKKVKVAKPKLKLYEHQYLVWITLAMIPFSLLYSQVTLVFPQHLKANFDDFLTIFASLMTINAIIVIFLQIPVAKISDRFPVHKVILITYICLAITALGYGWASSFILLVLAEIIFTIGEMLNGPQIQKTISMMAPPEFRGRYFSIFGTNEQISSMFGPVLGAFAFSQIGGKYWFTIICALLLIAGFLQTYLIRKVLYQGKISSSTETNIL